MGFYLRCGIHGDPPLLEVVVLGRLEKGRREKMDGYVSATVIPGKGLQREVGAYIQSFGIGGIRSEEGKLRFFCTPEQYKKICRRLNRKAIVMQTLTLAEFLAQEGGSDEGG